MFYVSCIIKRLNAKTFIIIYYYRRSSFNYKNFINYKVFNNRLNKFNKLKKLNFKLIKNNLKYKNNFLVFNELKNQKITYISTILQGKSQNLLDIKLNKNQTMINKRLKKIFYYSKFFDNINTFVANVNKNQLFLLKLQENNISTKYFFFLI